MKSPRGTGARDAHPGDAGRPRERGRRARRRPRPSRSRARAPSMPRRSAPRSDSASSQDLRLLRSVVVVDDGSASGAGWMLAPTGSDSFTVNLLGWSRRRCPPSPDRDHRRRRAGRDRHGPRLRREVTRVGRPGHGRVVGFHRDGRRSVEIDTLKRSARVPASPSTTDAFPIDIAPRSTPGRLVVGADLDARGAAAQDRRRPADWSAER